MARRLSKCFMASPRLPTPEQDLLHTVSYIECYLFVVRDRIFCDCLFNTCLMYNAH